MAPLRDMYFNFSQDAIVNVRICFCKSLVLLSEELTAAGRAVPREVLLEVVRAMGPSEDPDLRDAVGHAERVLGA
jgi:hypothetical protein